MTPREVSSGSASMQDGSQGSGDPAQPRRPVLPPGVSKRSRLTRRKQSRSSGQEAAQHSDQQEEEPAEEPIGSVLLEPTESLQLEELLRALPVYLSARVGQYIIYINI